MKTNSKALKGRQMIARGEARLFAAAPEMLAALESALMGTPFDESWRDKAKSAIAKAKGEKS